MEQTAKALLIAMSYLELWDDDVIDPDTAVAALESVSAELHNLTSKEKGTISKVAKQLAEDTSDDGEKEFFMEFVENFGLGE